MKIAKEGYPLVFGVAALAAITFLFVGSAAGVIVGVMAIAIAAFFRDPERVPPAGEGLIVSPADGKVVSIADVKDAFGFPDAVRRISIFLSPLDVHINRTPIEGEIKEVRYRRGKFLAAYKDEASARNEQNALRIEDSRGRKLGVVQIAGVLARRIVCRVRDGDKVARGDRYGLIMFGSRTDVYLPHGCGVEVVEGQRVKGGETILGRFV